MKYVGYKVMPLENGILIAGADKRQTFELKKNTNIKMNGNGIYIGMDKDYVMDYYSGLAEEEVFLTLEFNKADITTGNIEDKEPELSLRTAKIIDIHKIEDGEIIENKKKVKKNKISP